MYRKKLLMTDEQKSQLVHAQKLTIRAHEIITTDASYHTPLTSVVHNFPLILTCEELTHTFNYISKNSHDRDTKIFLPLMPTKQITLYIDRRVLNLKSAFKHKLLCDGPTFSEGDNCRMQCSFCYVEAIFARDPKIQDALTNAHTTFDQAVIRRNNPVAILREQLLKKGKRRFDSPADTRVIYASPLVDVAATVEMARETTELCRVILENTHWQIRLLC